MNPLFDKVDRDKMYVISGEHMDRLVSLNKQLQIPGVEVKNSVFDWPTIISEVVCGAQEAPMAKPVTQLWVNRLTFMMQSTILGAIRGPDGRPKYDPPKMLLRWFRRCILISALDGVVLTDPYDQRGGSFTGPSLNGPVDGDSIWTIEMKDHVTAYIKNLDAVPSHFSNHFRDAIEILGYKHPSPAIRAFWLDVYVRLVEDLHLLPETEEELDKRLGDNREDWLATADIATRA